MEWKLRWELSRSFTKKNFKKVALIFSVEKTKKYSKLLFLRDCLQPIVSTKWSFVSYDLKNNDAK